MTVTRERSKVRSLVRPPERSIKSDTFSKARSGVHFTVRSVCVVVSRCGAKSFRLKFQAAKPQQWRQARPGQKSSSPSRKPHRRFQACPPSGHANGSCQPPKAFSREVETGSRQENASNQQSRVPFRFYRNGKDSRLAPAIRPSIASWSRHRKPAPEASGTDSSKPCPPLRRPRPYHGAT